MDNTLFQELVWQKGRELYRDMPWRQTDDPYLIMVSELMLQQTQVDRVIPKYNLFIGLWPTIHDLASAPLSDVLTAWNGLGYNRRAQFLHRAALQVVSDFGGTMPQTKEGLQSLPGIGPNTAGAILAYAFNQPEPFIETNIRTVYFQHYFTEGLTVTDAQLKDIVSNTIDREHPREWFWALMDYGTSLKKQGASQLDKSAHYKKQSPLKGSLREVRGQIIRALTQSSMAERQLRAALSADDRFDRALDALRKERMVTQTGLKLHLTK